MNVINQHPNLDANINPLSFRGKVTSLFINITNDMLLDYKGLGLSLHRFSHDAGLNLLKTLYMA